MARFVVRRPTPIVLDESLRYGYYAILLVGVTVGAFGLGTLNTYLSLESFAIGKSVLGAVAGGVIAVELYKKLTRMSGSTGAYFVPSLAIGIAVGRIGCFLSGIEDYTYGIATTLPWGVDFGDGIARHPVQLYESIAMALFFGYSLWLYRYRRTDFNQIVFYQFIGYYALQRFVWEFLKPYATLAWGLNVFQWVTLGLLLYALSYYLNARRKR